MYIDVAYGYESGSSYSQHTSFNEDINAVIYIKYEAVVLFLQKCLRLFATFEWYEGSFL